jgi:hypothetical protein
MLKGKCNEKLKMQFSTTICIVYTHHLDIHFSILIMYGLRSMFRER